MGSCVFSKEDVDEVLDVINEVGVGKLRKREQLILDCVSNNDEPLINYLYDYVSEYLRLFYEENPANNTNKYNTNDEFFSGVIKFGIMVKQFEEKYKEQEQYLTEVLTPDEAYCVIKHIMEEYFGVEVENRT